ncbi:ATP-binding cassette domain-containing protein [Trinickia caryophylli]|uniref:Macrolide transport system ATP-binding/permease protein n=1 Tax=Trinickia caryophylli TaxID=28094 RepID=A0A1X7H4D0_TRICW|nr:ATP-binding cassette domain-containing protein [Trinickia caryophylli]WQE11939.1 ATP-binding cassette domain-containing protein [Trinickia caryophylli]GLU35671.1 macrolide export ATP-binding/permease protein MacB [Trinickia caryophylli]SMF79355.1 macrolide transport system ATP-binding/permease protein [Trinickia caryophylli]
MTQPLLRVRNVTRSFLSEHGQVDILDEINLDIEAGEFVAIIGASGSGKSTLLNVLGCLDRPTSGSYEVQGVDAATLSEDGLAALRRRTFGFVFQRYHLIPSLTAAENVELPALYACRPRSQRKALASRLLASLGLSHRANNFPSKLSGGEQQRVCIARALANECRVILADEPTAALDPDNSQEVIRTLHRLNKEGRTVVLVTHDPSIAAQATRTIEVSRGRIVADRYRGEHRAAGRRQVARPPSCDETQPGSLAPEPDGRAHARQRASDIPNWQQSPGWIEIGRMAAANLLFHRLYSWLTIIGVSIAIASLSLTQAGGESMLNDTLADMKPFDTHVITFFSSSARGRPQGRAFTSEDAVAVSDAPYVEGASLSQSKDVAISDGATRVQVSGIGVAPPYFKIQNLSLKQGVLFSGAHVSDAARVVVLNESAQKKLFRDALASIGKTILVNGTPCTIVGVVKSADTVGNQPPSAEVYLPYTTMRTRISGSPGMSVLLAKVRADVSTDAAERPLTALLSSRHGSRDFDVFNPTAFARTLRKAAYAMTMFLVAIGLASLVVGGTGICNAMIISISNRTSDIGIRKAIGARPADIRLQFVMEAAFLCAIGGLLGCAVSYGVGMVAPAVGGGMKLVPSVHTLAIGIVCAIFTGLLFGIYPASKAARLDPIDALTRG